MQGFLITLLICSGTMSALALLYMAASPLLAKRYSVTGRYYAWLVIVAGLIIPFRPHFGGALVEVDMPGNLAAPVIRAGTGTPAAAPIQPALPSALPGVSWWQIAAAVWLAGMIVFLACHLIKHRRFLKLAARWSENAADRATLALFQTLKAQMDVTEEIGLQICESTGSPMLVGFAKPRILLPKADFAEDELRFILTHELVHYKRKDLWYKCLVLLATAIHWFNPVVYLMARAIDVQCELSCDGAVVSGSGTDTRQSYSETIIGVVKYQSRLKTAFSTNFYGGKKGMKERIFSIMDTSKKKIGLSILCGVLTLTLGTGAAFAANAAGAEPQDPPGTDKEVMVAPWFSAYFMPSPEIYAPYAAFGVTVSEDGRSLLYQGRAVRQFVDEGADGWAFYVDETGSGNWTAVRNAAGELTGIESLSAEKAKDYYERFFADELDPDFPAKVNAEAARDMENDMVTAKVWEGENKYKKYEPFGVTYSEADNVLYFNGQRVKFFIDQPAGEGPDTLWTDGEGTVNAAVTHDASGQITGIESISDEKAREYQSAVDEYNQAFLDGLEERVEARINGLYSEN